MFRAKMARVRYGINIIWWFLSNPNSPQVAPKEVMVAKKVKDGHSDEDISSYRATFTRFDVDGGGAIDADELGKLIRVLG